MWITVRLGLEISPIIALVQGNIVSVSQKLSINYRVTTWPVLELHV